MADALLEHRVAAFVEGCLGGRRAGLVRADVHEARPLGQPQLGPLRRPVRHALALLISSAGPVYPESRRTGCSSPRPWASRSGTRPPTSSRRRSRSSAPRSSSGPRSGTSPRRMREVWDPARTWVGLGRRPGMRHVPVVGDASSRCRAWAQLPAAAVAAVTVLPTHRRRGILTRLAAAEHAALRERGEAVRPAVRVRVHQLQPLRVRARHPAHRLADHDPCDPRMRGGPTGTVQLVTPDAGARDQAKAVLEGWRVRQPGEPGAAASAGTFALGPRTEPWGKRWRGWIALRRDAAGRIDGYVRYSGWPEWAGEAPARHDRGQRAPRPRATTRRPRPLPALGRPRRRGPDGWPATERALSRGCWTTRAPRGSPRPATGCGSGCSMSRGRWRRGAMSGRRRWCWRWSTTRRGAAPTGTHGRRPRRGDMRATDREPDLTIPGRRAVGGLHGWTRLVDLAVAVGADEHSDGALWAADALSGLRTTRGARRTSRHRRPRA